LKESPKQTKPRSGKRRGLSLYPLSPDDAMRADLQTSPEGAPPGRDCCWRASDGSVLSLFVCRKDELWRAVPGLYIFVAVVEGRPCALFVGQTDNLRRDIPHHPQWAAAASMGATEVHAAQMDSATERDDWQRALIREFRPPLNVGPYHPGGVRPK